MTHVRPGLPVDQNPNPTPPNQGAFELHDAAALGQTEWKKQPTERFKGGFTYTLLFAFQEKVLGVGGLKISELIFKTLF